MAERKPVVAFDLYGTLLSTESIATELEKLFGDESKGLAAEARRLQLEYTWRCNSMGTYIPFDELTLNSFRHACHDAGLSLSAEMEDRIMKAYIGLSSFPDADRGLLAVAGQGGGEARESSPLLDAWIFSNGTREMVASSLATSRSLAPAAKAAGILLEGEGNPAGRARIVSVDDLVKVYKPDPRTYTHMVDITSAGGGGATDAAAEGRHDTWLVSSNPFDALGAVAAGLRSAWVDRKGTGWVDGLAGALGKRPTLVVKGVDEAVEEIIRRSGGI